MCGVHVAYHISPLPPHPSGHVRCPYMLVQTFVHGRGGTKLCASMIPEFSNGPQQDALHVRD